MKNPLLGKKLLTITAHPDDESYLLAGTIYENFKKGGENFLICATRGERGSSHLPKPITKKKLKLLREKELRRAAKFLKVKNLFILGLPDGQVVEYQKELVQKFWALAHRLKPEVILSFGADGITGHLDHIAVGLAAKGVAKRLSISFVAVSLPVSFFKMSANWLTQRRKYPHYKDRLNRQAPNLRIKINPRVKAKAISFHVSQMDGAKAFAGFPKYAVKAFMNAEYFVV